MKVIDEVNNQIVYFLEKKQFLDSALSDKSLGFGVVKIIDPQLADDIFSNTLNEKYQEKYDDWDRIVANELTILKDSYSLDKNDLSGFYYKIYRFVESKLDDKNIEYNNLCENIPYLLDSFIGDFTKIIFNDLTKKNNKLFNDILQVYLAGGWPCGWEGIYPEGKIVIFSNE